MVSLLGLFALFFAKRSLLGPAEDPGMCGVIKSLATETSGTNAGNNGGERERGGGGGGAWRGGRGGAEGGGWRGAGATWHGNVLLDERGAAEVRLPAGVVVEVRRFVVVVVAVAVVVVVVLVVLLGGVVDDDVIVFATAVGVALAKFAYAPECDVG